jgi:predicted DNA-binding transcriptional regulator YafY
MTIKSRLEIALKLLFYLSGSFGHSMNEICERFSIPKRTAYRYLSDLRNAGFVIPCEQGYYKVDKNKGEGKSLSDLLHFSEEEAWLLSKAIHSIDDSSTIKINLAQKLYSLYDFGRVAQTIIKKENSENIHTIIKAIKSKKQLKLHNYKSGNSNNITTRLVEPVNFTTNFISVWCFEPGSMENKLFKTSRIGKCELLPDQWKFEDKHQEGHVDVFRMSSFNSLPVKLKLTLRAKSLLCEEYSLAEKYITEDHTNHYLFETEVCNYAGVARFVMGLFEEIEVLETNDFKRYLKEKQKKIRF